MTSANPAVLPFLVPSVPEPFVQHIYATQPDPSSTPLAVQLHNLPPCTSSAHLITALQLALRIKDASQLLNSVDIDVSKPDALLQVEGVHPKPSSSSIPSLFVHSAGKSVQEQHYSHTSALIHLTSKSVLSKLLSSWTHLDQEAELPRWPQSHILSHADLYEMQRPLLSTACKHADDWMDAFEAQPQAAQEADPATLSNRAKKRLAAQETQAEKLARKQAKQAAKALDKGDEQAGEWTVVSYAGGKQPKQKQTVLSTQTQTQPQAQQKVKGKKRDVKGFKIDNAGNVSESGDKKSKFMPADFYKPKKEEQRKKGRSLLSPVTSRLMTRLMWRTSTVLGDLQSKFSQDKAKAAALGNKSDTRRFKPY